jgi:hypothetical protein
MVWAFLSSLRNDYFIEIISHIIFPFYRLSLFIDIFSFGMAWMDLSKGVFPYYCTIAELLLKLGDGLKLLRPGEVISGQ